MAPKIQEKRGLAAGRNRAVMILLLLLVVLLAAGGVCLLLLFERENPRIAVLNNVALLGRSAVIRFAVDDQKSGIRQVTVDLVQGQNRISLYNAVNPRQGYFSKAGPNHIEENLAVDCRKLGLNEGSASLEILVRDFSFAHFLKGNEARLTSVVSFDTKPPAVSIVDSPRYILAGGAGMVIYRLSEAVDKHGAYVNGEFFPGFPLPQKGENTYGAMIAVQHNATKLEKAGVEAEDQAGNKGLATFSMDLKIKNPPPDKINISDAFLSEKLPEFIQHYPELQEAATDIERYVIINNKIREENNRRIREVCAHSRPEKLWDGLFERLARSSTRAKFAEQRTYFYQDKQVDEQFHLGVDLASVRHSDATAANRGIVVFADYLGIYGNTVILDHGLGLFSLYSHLNEITATVGQELAMGEAMGQTGMTGMAGGDHLHFSLLVSGIFVTPLEWWDPSWIQLHITDMLK